jgi:hypothetical protein
MNTKKWDDFKVFLNSFFPQDNCGRSSFRKSMFWGSAFIDDVRTCDPVLADKMQKIQDAYTEMYAYVSSRQNDGKDVI